MQYTGGAVQCMWPMLKKHINAVYQATSWNIFWNLQVFIGASVRRMTVFHSWGYAQTFFLNSVTKHLAAITMQCKDPFQIAQSSRIGAMWQCLKINHVTSPPLSRHWAEVWLEKVYVAGTGKGWMFIRKLNCLKQSIAKQLFPSFSPPTNYPLEI